MTALNFRVLNVLAAGVGYLCLSSLNKWRNKNAFKVQAQALGETRWKNENLVFELGRYGIPKRDLLLTYDDIQVSYDNRYKAPNWVLEHLTREKLMNSLPVDELVSAIPETFYYDENIPDIFQAHEADFNHKDIRKGRLVAGNNHRQSVESYKNTLIGSTSAGISYRLTTSFWPDLEAYTRYLTTYYKDIFVFTGPLYLPEDKHSTEIKIDVFGYNQVGFPSHFFKLVLGKKPNGGIDIGCYLVPNGAIDDSDSLSCYRVSISELEHKAGFKMFNEQAAYDLLGELVDVQDFRFRRREYMEHAKLGNVW